MKDTFCVPLWNTANQDTILSHLHWFYQQMITSLQQHQGKCALCTEIVGPALDLDMICTLENSENKYKLWVLLCKIPPFFNKACSKQATLLCTKYYVTLVQSSFLYLLFSVLTVLKEASENNGTVKFVVYGHHCIIHANCQLHIPIALSSGNSILGRGLHFAYKGAI